MKLDSYFATIGSMEEQKQVDIISNNIANSNSPGFKKDSMSFSDVLGDVFFTSMSQGPIRETGEMLDIALSGEGFLSVQTDQGTLYTRAGNLTLNKTKQLVTRDGWPVLGKSGPITVNDISKFRVGENGQVFDGNDPVDQLNIVQFSPNSLQKAQNGYFQPLTTEIQPATATNCTVRQGYLEGANFNPVEEMAKMVLTMRIFESYQKALQNSGSLDNQLIAKTSG
ncbi:MAG TPA: flagellar hook basal-body protein [Syntrophobacteraceae bacterium]|nr:flagellar hook basal-body protein [Syntrophobacteraceae bacterium]